MGSCFKDYKIVFSLARGVIRRKFTENEAISVIKQRCSNTSLSLKLLQDFLKDARK